jgi:hypothetical protein
MLLVESFSLKLVDKTLFLAFSISVDFFQFTIHLKLNYLQLF